MAALENTDVSMTDLLQPNQKNSSSYNYSDSYRDYLTFERNISIIIPIICGCIVLLGFLGNTMVIIVLLTNKAMQRISNIPIFNLEVADLGFIVLFVPTTAIQYALPRIPLADVWCKMHLYISNVSVYASVYTIVIMSADRYLAMVHPIASNPFRKKANIMGIIAIMWIIILLGHIPIIFHSDIKVLPYSFAYESRPECVITLFIEIQNSKIFTLVFLIFGYVLPLLLVCVKDALRGTRCESREELTLALTGSLRVMSCDELAHVFRSWETIIAKGFEYKGGDFEKQ